MIAAVLALCITQASAEPARAPGGVEIQAVREHVSHLRTYGYADLEQGVRMHGNTVLRIASLTKQFTAVAVLRLAQDGSLALDDTLARRLPNCPPTWSAITLRQLLSHTSGLSGDLAPLFVHVHDDLTPRQLIDLYAELPLVSSPGTQWAYANINYWILGLVVEAASGQAYGDYVSEHVLAPAGLSSTRIGDWSAIIERRARGYGESPGGAIVNGRHFSTTLGYSAGGYVSTAGDIARWYGALGRGRIISLGLLRQALTPVLLEGGENSGYGLGWYVSNVNGRTIVHHGGSTFGFRAYIYWRPDDGAFAGVFLNSEGEEPQEAARALLVR
jgi:CubicO group peptidase (beta-lactamase class C family)